MIDDRAGSASINSGEKFGLRARSNTGTKIAKAEAHRDVRRSTSKDLTILIITDERPESFPLKAAVLQLPGEEIESLIITGSKMSILLISRHCATRPATLPVTGDSAIAVPAGARSRSLTMSNGALLAAGRSIPGRLGVRTCRSKSVVPEVTSLLSERLNPRPAR
jgi:hypothetical protein